MPLTEKVMFTATLQAASKIQVPKVIRWRFKMEVGQAIKVGVNFLELHKGWQFFYTKMRKDGRLAIPKLVLSLFVDENTILSGSVVEVILEPA